MLIAYGMIIHLLVVIPPQPFEYREGAALHITRQLQSSVNIYDFKRQPYGAKTLLSIPVEMDTYENQ